MENEFSDKDFNSRDISFVADFRQLPGFAVALWLPCIKRSMCAARYFLAEELKVRFLYGLIRFDMNPTGLRWYFIVNKWAWPRALKGVLELYGHNKENIEIPLLCNHQPTLVKCKFSVKYNLKYLNYFHIIFSLCSFTFLQFKKNIVCFTPPHMFHRYNYQFHCRLRF